MLRGLPPFFLPACLPCLCPSSYLPLPRPALPAAGESLIEEAVQCALDNGWVEPNDHIVVVSRSHIDELMVKVGAVGAGC